MKIFGFQIFKKKKPVVFPAPSEASKDEVKAPIKKKIKINKLPRVKSPVLAYKLRSGTVEFEQPEYDMAEIGRIEDVEAYVQRAFTQKEGLMFKEGWELVGKNPQTIKYVKERFGQISWASQLPFKMLLRGIGEDLIRFSNAYLVKVRNVKASGGKPRKVVNRQGALEPVAGYFPMPAATVRFKRDDFGRILKYRQEMPSGKWKDFSPDDVIHIYFRKKKGFLVGTPSLIPVKDDIRALRRIEENIEMLVYQHLFPLYHYKVGSENAPAERYPDGTDEIDVVKTEIEIMPSEGMIVTPERHEIKAIGAEGRALRAEGYLTHFKQRIFAGLGVSAIDMGEGDTSNRSTADNMSRNMVDDVKHYQRTIEMFINEFVIKELLLESTFANPLDEENIVRLGFSEIDLDAKIKVQNHAIEAFSGYALTHSELRKEFGKEPLTEQEWEDTFWKRIKEPQLLIQAIDEPYCYSSDTEVLTEKGWKLFQDLVESDKVATLYGSEILGFEKPLRIFKYDWQGDLYNLQTRFIDLRVTPNHKLYVNTHQKSHMGYGDYNLIRADEVEGKYKRFKRTAIWEGRHRCNFVVAGTDIRLNRHKNDHLASCSVDGDDFLQLLAWYISEGYLTKPENGTGYGVVICQDRDIHPAESEEIWDIIERLGGKPRWAGKKQIVFNDKRFFEELQRTIPGDSYSKRIPSFIKELDPKQIRLFINTLMKGDGETTYHYLYSTVSKELADDLQELALYAGWAASVGTDSSGRDTPIYRIAIHRDKYADVADRVPYGSLADSSTEGMVAYKGKVYCVETTTGLLYVRRNGKACWCGNSAEAQAVARNQQTSITPQDLDEEETKRNKEIEKQGQIKKGGGSKSTGTGDTPGQRAARSKNRPSNQYGVKHGPEKRKSSLESYFVDMVAPGNKVTSLYDDLQDEAMRSLTKGTFSESWFRQLAFAAGTLMKEKLLRMARLNFRFGFRSMGVELTANDEAGPFLTLETRVISVVDRFLNLLVDSVTDSYIKSQEGSLSLKKAKVSTVFDSMRFRSRFIYASEGHKARNYGVLHALRKTGLKEAIIVAEPDACEVCQAASGKFSIEYATISDIPGFHPNCKCTIQKA